MDFFLASIFAAIVSCNMNPGRQERPIFSIGIVADVQYADIEPAGNRYYRLSRERLKEAYDTFKTSNVDFVMNLGDIIDRDYESYQPVMELIKSSRIRTSHVSGNHDYAVEPFWKKRLPVLLGHWEGYYSLAMEGFRFIYLNGNEISTYAPSDTTIIANNRSYLDSLKDQKKINAMDWNGGIGQKQISFLKNELDLAQKKHEKVLIACHFPIFPENVHNLFNYEEVLELLGRYKNVIAWFNGHNHAGNYGQYGDIHCVTFKGMVDTPTENSFAIVDLYDHKLVIRGFGREKDLKFSF